jgi:predicted CopG family antitoxin
LFALFLSSCQTMSVSDYCMQPGMPERYASFSECVRDVAAKRQRNSQALMAIGNSYSAPAPTQQKQIDQRCLQECNNAGYDWGLCESKCSY